jgi:hypothetical protein
VATAIARFVEGGVATKAQLDAAKAELKTDIAVLRTDLRTDIQAVRTEIVKLDAKVEQIGSRTFNRLGALMAVVAGVLFAALHLWPPH